MYGYYISSFTEADNIINDASGIRTPVDIVAQEIDVVIPREALSDLQLKPVKFWNNRECPGSPIV